MANFESHRMLIIEKVLLLKSINLFTTTPENVLVDVAQILEEEEIEADTPLFKAGDSASCMYIIAKGEVKIHMGEHTIAVLSEQDFFGELSLLDTETRSADATTSKDSLLLKIDQEPFYELIETRTEVAKGIIQTLCRRLREQNKKNVELSDS